MEDKYLACEKQWIFYLLMFVGGYFGGFTYTIRGGVFCNAQTGNVVLLGLNLASQEWMQALYLLLPISAYFLGSILSEEFGLSVKKYKFLRWDTLFILFEMISVVFLALLPESAPFQITQVMINFICAMQFNTFRQAESVAMATTFCTAHIRQTGMHFVRWLRHKEKSEELEVTIRHTNMLLIFLAGVIISSMLSKIFLGKALFFALIPLMIVFIYLALADLTYEKELLNKKPHGH